MSFSFIACGSSGLPIVKTIDPCSSLQSSLFKKILPLLLASILLLYVDGAFAHVKWFTKYDLSSPPLPVRYAFGNNLFLTFFALMLPITFVTGYVDSYMARHANHVNRFLAKGNAWFEPQFFVVMQLSVLAFFGALFVYGGILLTPELTIPASDRKWVQWVQLAIAVMVLNEKIACLSALGILCLYAMAVYQYGLFHLLDYPIFIGVGAYIFIVSVFGERHSLLGKNILRVLTGITLMWAGLEKFAYPDWSYKLFIQQPDLMMGFNPEFFMVAAGFVEFSAAYWLITGGLASRASAAVLLVFFVTAIPVFGVVDAIGHAVIIMVLLSMIFMPNPITLSLKGPGRSPRNKGLLHVGTYYGALLLTAVAFYGGHWLSYGR